jgi:hypothetical protein
MTEQKLCWRCREDFQEKYGPNGNIRPFIHCHHDAPEEKPEVKCWCWHPNLKMVTLPSSEVVEIQFCPVCGKPRKDWGK